MFNQVLDLELQKIWNIRNSFYYEERLTYSKKYHDFGHSFVWRMIPHSHSRSTKSTSVQKMLLSDPLLAVIWIPRNISKPSYDERT